MTLLKTYRPSQAQMYHSCEKRQPHDDAIKWKYFPRNWPFVRETGTGDFPTQRPVTQSFNVVFICVWINGWVKNREAGDLRRHRGHYDVNVMWGTSFN